MRPVLSATLLLAVGSGCLFDPPRLNVGDGSSTVLDGGVIVDPDAAADAASPPVDTGVTTDSGQTPTDTGFADAAPPADQGFADAGFVDTGPADTGVVDTGPTDVGFPDTGPADVGFADTGVQPTPCDTTYASATTFENVRSLAPDQTGNIRSPWLSPNGQILYVALERPRTMMMAGQAFDMYVYRRNQSTGPFVTVESTNLDLRGPGENTSDDFDMTFVPSTGRFWFTVVRDIFIEIDSAELSDPTRPAAFRDFSNEVQGFPGAERNRDYRGPALTTDGLTLVSSIRNTGTNDWDLVEHDRAQTSQVWGSGARLSGLNSGDNDFDAWLSGDGLMLLYASNRGATYDIFCAYRANRGDSWIGPVVYGGPQISSAAADDRTPFMNGTSLLLTRRQGPVPEDILIANP